MEERAAFFLKQEVVPVVMFEEGVWMEYALTHGLDALLRDLLVHGACHQWKWWGV